MLRLLATIGGLTGALALSQFPEFSQQYLQRLSGAVDEMQVVVSSYDSDAAEVGLEREEYVNQMAQDDVFAPTAKTIANNINRYERLNDQYDALKNASPLGRLAQPWRFSDVELVERTWDEFKPAVPVTADGFIAAGIGYVGGWALITVLVALLRAPFRRRRRA